jgi:hypothetical protein
LDPFDRLCVSHSHNRTAKIRAKCCAGMYKVLDTAGVRMEFDKDIRPRQSARPPIRWRQLSSEDRQKRRDRATVILLCGFSATGIAVSVLDMLGLPHINILAGAVIVAASLAIVLALSVFLG